MWTLEGLGALDAALVRALMADPTPRIRVHAIRASETLFKAGNRSFDADYKTLSKDKDPDVAIQALLTLNLFKTPDMAAIVKTSQEANTSRGVSEIGGRSSRRRSTRSPAAGAADSVRHSRTSCSAGRRSTPSSASRVTGPTATASRSRAPRRA